MVRKMKKNVNEKRYPNINEAAAFKIAFIPMLYAYDDISCDQYEEELCKQCHYAKQKTDFLTPKGPAGKMHRAILDTYHYGVNEEIRDLLIENFEDITEEDFRPCRTKQGEIVFWQIEPRHVMFPMAKELEYVKRKECGVCGRIQYWVKEYTNELGNSYYYITKEALADLHSLNESYEKYVFGIPEWVVTREVYEFLTERYPRMEFAPMFLKK